MTNLAAWIVVGALGTASIPACAADLSRYREFQLGADLPAIARQAASDASAAKVLDTRPALIQELAWNPRPLGPTVQPESVREVVFSFYNASLFRITVNYDRYETAGLATADFVEMISATHGTAQKAARTNISSSGEPEEAPKRDAARLASEQAATQAELDQVRLVNKAKFRL